MLMKRKFSSMYIHQAKKMHMAISECIENMLL